MKKNKITILAEKIVEENNALLSEFVYAENVKLVEKLIIRIIKELIE